MDLKSPEEVAGELIDGDWADYPQFKALIAAAIRGMK